MAYSKKTGLKIKSNAAYYKAHPEYRYLNSARVRAARKGVPFSIGLDDVRVLLTETNCPDCGVEYSSWDGYAAQDRISIDRMTPALGYVPGNIRACCKGCNSKKRDRTLEEWLQFLRDTVTE